MMIIVHVVQMMVSNWHCWWHCSHIARVVSEQGTHVLRLVLLLVLLLTVVIQIHTSVLMQSLQVGYISDRMPVVVMRGAFEPFPAAQETAVVEHVLGGRIERPVIALARVARFTCYFDEAVI